ncbi:MAG: hypothetical protein AAGJ52_11460 [Pseudomonadota bacterium]
MSRQTLLALSLCAFALTACQSNEPEPINDEPPVAVPEAPSRASTSDTIDLATESRREIETTSGRPARTVDPSAEIPRLEGNLTESGYGLTMIIDGSSPQAFADSLEMIASDTSPEQFRQLDSAIRFLQAYSLGVDSLGEFYQSLDGQTPEEIIARVQQRDGRQR